MARCVVHSRASQPAERSWATCRPLVLLETPGLPPAARQQRNHNIHPRGGVQACPRPSAGASMRAEETAKSSRSLTTRRLSQNPTRPAPSSQSAGRPPAERQSATAGLRGWARRCLSYRSPGPPSLKSRGLCLTYPAAPRSFLPSPLFVPSILHAVASGCSRPIPRLAHLPPAACS